MLQTKPICGVKPHLFSIQAVVGLAGVPPVTPVSAAVERFLKKRL